jgi:hypothetical protein
MVIILFAQSADSRMSLNFDLPVTLKAKYEYVGMDNNIKQETTSKQLEMFFRLIIDVTLDDTFFLRILLTIMYNL